MHTTIEIFIYHALGAMLMILGLVVMIGMAQLPVENSRELKGSIALIVITAVVIGLGWALLLV